MDFYQDLNNIQIFVEYLIDKSYGEEHVGTGFSGGIDSFSTILNHYQKQINENDGIDVLVSLNVGAHGSLYEEIVNSKFETRYEALSPFAKELKIPFIKVDSNLYQFHPLGHQLTCTLTLVSGILVLQGYLELYYVASLGLTFIDQYKFIRFDLNKDIAILDHSILRFFDTESLSFVLDGVYLNRVEKTTELFNYEPIYRYLNVCVSSDLNFKNCSKCQNTLGQ